MDHVLINADWGYVVCVSTDVELLNEMAEFLAKKRNERFEVRAMTRAELGDHMYEQARETRHRDMLIAKIRNLRIHNERQLAAQRRARQAAITH